MQGPPCKKCKAPTTEVISNSENNPGRPYWRCLAHSFSEWADGTSLHPGPSAARYAEVRAASSQQMAQDLSMLSRSIPQQATAASMSTYGIRGVMETAPRTPDAQIRFNPYVTPNTKPQASASRPAQPRFISQQQQQFPTTSQSLSQSTGISDSLTQPILHEEPPPYDLGLNEVDDIPPPSRSGHQFEPYNGDELPDISSPILRISASSSSQGSSQDRPHLAQVSQGSSQDRPHLAQASQGSSQDHNMMEGAESFDVPEEDEETRIAMEPLMLHMRRMRQRIHKLKNQNEGFKKIVERLQKEGAMRNKFCERCMGDMR
ncbi:hypothetical protein BC829DRAFT_397662 [Chytridium lagenaria]|nr:hypothetical protein BC829DRAFT_397662 [Chytridium lagenaria]